MPPPLGKVVYYVSPEVLVRELHPPLERWAPPASARLVLLLPNGHFGLGQGISGWGKGMAQFAKVVRERKHRVGKVVRERKHRVGPRSWFHARIRAHGTVHLVPRTVNSEQEQGITNMQTVFTANLVEQ